MAAHASRNGVRSLRSCTLLSFIAPSLFLIAAFCCLFISVHLLQDESSNTEPPLHFFWTVFCFFADVEMKTCSFVVFRNMRNLTFDLCDCDFDTSTSREPSSF